MPPKDWPLHNSAPLPTAAEVDRAVAAVFRRPEFAERTLPGPLARLAEWYQQVKAAIGEWLGQLVLSDRSGSVVFWIFVGWLVLTVVAVGLYFVRSARRGWKARDQGAGATSGGSAPVAKGAAWWEAQARRAAEEGHWREAALALYQALLHRLDERGALRYDAAKTPGDYRREARGNPEVFGTLNGFLRVWEPVAFGGRGVDAPGYTRLRDLAAEGGTRG